jgi:hypothetical protein
MYSVIPDGRNKFLSAGTGEHVSGADLDTHPIIAWNKDPHAQTVSIRE